MTVQAAEKSGYRRRKDDPTALDVYDAGALGRRSLTSDPHLNMLLYLLDGIPPYRRMDWMRHNCPRTMAVVELLHIDPMFLEGKIQRRKTQRDERDLYDG